MDNTFLNSIKEQAENQLKAMGEAMKMAESVIQNLPSDIKVKVPNAQMEVNSIKEKLENGDSSGLSDILKKYSNPSQDIIKKDAYNDK